MLAFAAALAGAAQWASGCSVLYDLSTQQCSVDADCAAWAGLICTEGICKEPVYQCVTHEDCLDSEVALTSPAACIQNECQALKTADCPTILPVIGDEYIDNLRADDALILGAFSNTVESDYGLVTKNYDLAIHEFTQAGVGRPIVMVVCNNEQLEDGALDRSMTHLADTLRVPGVIGTLPSTDLEYVVESKGLEAGMFFMSPLDSDSTLVTLQDDGLVWHMLPGGEAIARSYAPLVERVIAYLEQDGLTGPVRIAHVKRPSVRFLSDLAATIERSPAPFDSSDPGGISFNGMSVFDNTQADNYQSFVIDGPNDPTASETILELVAFKPHIIIASSAGEFPSSVGPTIEMLWNEAEQGQPKPFYILSPYTYQHPNTEPFVSNNAGVRTRFIGINAPAALNVDPYQQYLLRWNDTFPEDEGEAGRENFYDAAYYLLYSAIAAGELLQTGRDMARGMGRLTSGSLSFDVGPGDLAEAAQALTASSAPITLNGTMGPPNFNLINGGRTDAGSVWCYSVLGLQSDVLRYDASDGTMQGNFTCFPDF